MIVFICSPCMRISRYHLHKIIDILRKIKYPYAYNYKRDEILLRKIKFKAVSECNFENARIGYRDYIICYESDIEKVKPILEIIKKYELEAKK